MERLNFTLSALELKADDAAPMTFKGYGAVFGNVDAYGDVIAKGAFAKSVAAFKSDGVWPSMLAQHGGWGISSDDMTPVGVWTEIREDDTGLYVEGQLADTPRGRELYTLMKMSPRPAINGMSIGFFVKQKVMGSKPEEPRRTLTEIDLVEISLVTFPANGKARVASVKSEGAMPSVRELERALRDAGCSRTQAKAILSDGLKAMPLRDAEGEDEVAALLRRNINAINGKPQE